MGLFGIAVGAALSAVRDKVLNPRLVGIGEVSKITYDKHEGVLSLQIVLLGMEDRPITVEARDMEIAPDGSSIRVKSFRSPLPFAHNALNRFATRPFPVPPGMARIALKTAKPVLGL